LVLEGKNMKSINIWEKVELSENSKNPISIVFKGGESILADEIYVRTDEKNNIYYKIINGYRLAIMDVSDIVKREKGENNFEIRYKKTSLNSPLVVTYELNAMCEMDYVLDSEEEAIKNLTKRHKEWIREHPTPPNIFKKIYNNILGKKENITINVRNDFSETPGPRYKTEGEYSGELFKELVILKAKQAIKEGKKLFIDLDGCPGYATSFLHEAFAETNIDLGISKKDFLKMLILKSDEEPSLIQEITLNIER
jgi:hypothetical protein